MTQLTYYVSRTPTSLFMNCGIKALLPFSSIMLCPVARVSSKHLLTSTPDNESLP
jgi:hypothetical protein